MKKYNAKPKVTTGGYKQQYGVIIICSSEEDQEKVYTALRVMSGDRQCRVVVT